MRRVLLAVGLPVTVAGGALLLTPLSAPIDLPVVPALGGVALLGLLIGAVAVRDRLTTDPETATLPDPSDRSGGDAPGDEFDRALATVSAREGGEDRSAIRNRLETAVVTQLVETEGCSREEARRQLANGDWTDDERAATCFADDRAPTPSLRERVRSLVAGEPPFARRASRAAEVLGEWEDDR